MLRDQSGSSLYLPFHLHFCSICSSEELSVDPVKSAGLSGHVILVKLLQIQDQDPEFTGRTWRDIWKALSSIHQAAVLAPKDVPGVMCISYTQKAPTSSTFACRLCQCFHGKVVFSTVYYTAINKIRSHSG